jgi:hypothetical protein
MSVLRLVTAALLVFPTSLLAQRVSGIVKLPGDAPNAGGILVVAVDSTGSEIARAVTSEEGRFALPLPRPGMTRIEVQRVGFRPTLVLERPLAAGEAITVEPVASATVTELPPRGSTPPTSCGGTPDGQRYVATLLDEMRKALVATQMNATRTGVTARWAVTDHRLAGNGRDTSRYAIVRRAGAPTAAYGTPVQNELARSGFVVTAGKDRIFRGLDVPTLLSPWFQESYCFTAREGSPTTFVISFAPKTRPRGDYVNITGDIHLVRASLDLLSIEYLYDGLKADEDKRLGGGRMEFARADGGSWLVASWYIRFPQVGLIELETFRTQDRARLLQPDVLGHEFLAWHTTAMLEGTRRIYVKEAQFGAPLEGPLRAACTERILPAPTGAARGRLTYEGRPVSGSRVRATWRVAKDIGGEVPLWRDEIREVSTSNRGDWVLCDIPAGTPVELSWEIMGRRSSTSLRVERDQLVTLDESGKPTG